MTDHEELEARLSDYVDGELEGPEQRAVAAHVAGCAACRQMVADLEAVARTARSLPAQMPAADLWPGIAARLEPPATARAGRVLAFSLPQLAAASVLLAVLSGWLAVRVVAPRLRPAAGDTPSAPTQQAARADGSAAGDRVLPASLDDTEYDAAVADLKLALEKGHDSLDPATVQIIEDNLNTIGRAVDDARQALARDPANDDLSRYLFDTERRQLDMLRQTVALVSRVN